MKIVVVFDFGDIFEIQNVRNTRKFWRKVSKYCKRNKRYEGKIGRVVSVYKY